MKIAFFHNLPPGGAKRVLYEQVRYLLKEHEVHAYEIESLDNKFSRLGNLVKVFNYEFKIKNNFSGFFARAISDFDQLYSLCNLHKKIAGDIDSGNYNIVIIHPDKYTQSPFLLRFLKTPSIYYCEEWLRIVYEPQYKFGERVHVLKNIYENVNRKIRKQIDKKNILSAKLILSNSEFTARNIEKAYKRRALVCYPGVNTDIFKPLDFKKEYDVLFIGEKLDIEGYDLVEKSTSLFKVKPVVKVVNRKKGKFLLTDNELVEEYNKAKIVVALNINEPFGLIPLEAMSCGIPVIAVSEGGFKETVVNGKTGFLIKRDSKMLYLKLKKILGDSKLREKMSREARKVVIENWNWEKKMSDLTKIINRFT